MKTIRALGDAVGLEQQQKEIERGGANKRFEARWQTEPHIATENSPVIVECLSDVKALTMDTVEEEDRIDEQAARRGDYGAQRGATNTQFGKAELAEDQYPGERYIDQHTQHIGNHHDAGFTNTAEIARHTGLDQGKEGAAHHHVVVLPLQYHLFRRVPHSGKQAAHTPGNQQ